MRLALIDFYIRNQKLSKNGPAIVAGSIKYVDCSFTFKTSDWDGLDKWLHLEKGEEVYNVELIEDAIPKERGLTLGAGIWHISLFGEGADGTRITTDSVTVEVDESSVPEGGPLPVLEQTEAEQIAAKSQSAFDKAAEALAAASAVKEAAENGEFDGYSPKIDVSYFRNYEDRTSGAVIKVINKDGSFNIATVYDGKNGERGSRGERGPAGENATAEQIAEAVEDYFEENPISGGGGSAKVTAESIITALGFIPADEEDIPTVPTKVSAYENDAGYAKKTELPTKMSQLDNDLDYAQLDDLPEVPVKSVNNKVGAVQLSYSDVGAEKSGAVGMHNTSADSHNDIRIVLTELKAAVEAFLDIDEPTFDQLSELIQAIKANAGSVTELTNGKVNVSDIVNNLGTNASNKPLSAAQGVKLKQMIQDFGDTLDGACSVAEGASDKVDDLEERMNSGEFKGEKGDMGPRGPEYTLTNADKTSIAAAVKESFTTENWIFELADGTSVTKAVLLG